ncbi:MAG: hypothetical protein JNN15_03620, partial [Blastocatellia bacterium]|nr:hypothetical protein [Blastocatellia bacterium]
MGIVKAEQNPDDQNDQNDQTEKKETINHDAIFKELLTVFFIEFIEAFVPDVDKYLDKDS